MNNSGSAVAGVMADEGAAPGDLVVVVDDFALPLGTLRIRPRGSDGGHNGLASILMALGSDAFPRVRCGIRSEPMPPKSQMAEFVLSRFAAGENATAQEMIVRAADAVQAILGEGIATAMNRYNT
jgi:PTH1 family peptidyl-tRNA hydrolase